MKKLSICLVFFICLMMAAIPSFAEEYNSVEDLISDVNEVIPIYDTEADVVTDQSEYINNDTGETGSTGSSEELAVLNDIATTLVEIEAESLFNINSSQVEYFKGVLLSDPFVDYCITFDGEQTYRLFYGHNLEVGSSANLAYITRYSSGSYNYNYQVVTGSTGTVPSSGVYVSTITDGMPILEEVENAKSQKIIQISFVVMLGLWLLSKLFFR